MVQFSNPVGTEKAANSICLESPASGTPKWEHLDEYVKKSKLVQGYIESSNVQAAEEMVNLIVAQRAYEMNSKVITASDTMMQQANELKR